MSRRTHLGVVLLLAGLLAVGAGASAHVQARKCQVVQTVVVTPAGDAPPADRPRVAYGDLSPTAQQVFDRARESDGGVLARRGVIDPAVVVDGERRYLVEVGRDRDCAPFDPLSVQTPLAAGVGLVVVGLALARG